MTVPLLTLPEGGQIHIYINAPPAGSIQGVDAAISAPPRRRPLVLASCAVLLVGAGYVLHASTSTPAAADILASRFDTLRSTMPQPPLPNQMPPALRFTPPRPHDYSSFASRLLPVPGAAAPGPAPAIPAAPPSAATLGPASAAAPAASPFGLR